MMVSTKTLGSTTLFNIGNNDNGIFLASNQHIRIISEGSCVTEDWSNDAENCFDGRKNYIQKHIKKS